jgi:hypothetical protein
LAHLRFVTVPGGCVHANERLSDPQKFVTFWTHRETNHITFKVIPLTILHMIHVIIPICPSPPAMGKKLGIFNARWGLLLKSFFFFFFFCNGSLWSIHHEKTSKTLEISPK